MIESIDPKAIYNSHRKFRIEYQADHHCPLIIEIMATKGTVSAFCLEAFISDTTFYKWVNHYPIFQECYRYGVMVAQEMWEEEGRNGKFDENFNLELWRTQGAARYGVGKSNRVRVHLNAEDTPYVQYKQLLNQASMGDFTASELKQLMEAVNIGIRAYESFELQKEVEQLKSDLVKMRMNSANNIIPITQTA